MAGIECRHLQKAYAVDGQTLSVFQDLHLEIPAGSITVLLGRSGCGKTTLLRLIGGLDKPDAGEIRFSGSHRTAFVFQEPRLMPWLNVWENVCFGLKKPQIDKAVIHSLLETVGLAAFATAYPHQLSGGMQQRVAIARALAYQPSFIMMDEPFAALDHFTRRQMQQELIRLQKQQGVSILFVTHSIEEALLLGHKIAILDNGSIKKELLIETDSEERDLLSPAFIDRKREILSQLEIPR